jgi:hypothetical protein
LIQLAWRFLLFQKDSALVQGYRARVETGAHKTKMVVALARKRLIVLWRIVTTGEFRAREEKGERESRVSARAALSWRAADNDPRGW